MTLRDQIVKDLEASAMDRAPTEKSNAGKVLWPIFFWQVVEEVATKLRKQSWEVASTEGVVKSDDQLRALGEGEHNVLDSNHFSVLASVTKPRMLFDRELFIANVAKKYKLDVGKLTVMAEACKIENKPALSKRIVEAAK